MKHISTFLKVRELQIEYSHYQLAMFREPREKGSREWSAFDAVQGDRSHSYPMRISRKPIVTREPGHILPIAYPQRFHPAH
jgi:hypothetical protein